MVSSLTTSGITFETTTDNIMDRYTTAVPGSLLRENDVFPDNVTIICLLGLPCAGKSKTMSHLKDIHPIQMSKALREHHGKTLVELPDGEKKTVEYCCDNAYLVDGSIVIDAILTDYFVNGNGKKTIVIDGIPRSKSNAEHLNRVISDFSRAVVIYLDISAESARQRMQSRSGSRADDTEAIFKKRCIMTLQAAAEVISYLSEDMDKKPGLDIIELDEIEESPERLISEVVAGRIQERYIEHEGPFNVDPASHVKAEQLVRSRIYELAVMEFPSE